MNSVRSTSSGFTLLEMMIVLVVLGIVAAFLVPGATVMSQGMQLNGAASNMAGQLQLCRSTAMATGVDQMMHFSADSLGSDYHIHEGGNIRGSWKLPNGVTYVSPAFQSVTMMRNGRASTSTYIVLQNRRGDMDTVSVQASGLITVY